MSSRGWRMSGFVARALPTGSRAPFLFRSPAAGRPNRRLMRSRVQRGTHRDLPRPRTLRDTSANADFRAPKPSRAWKEKSAPLGTRTLEGGAKEE